MEHNAESTKPHTPIRKQKKHHPECRVQVALKALKEIKTIQQIAKKFDIHPVKVSEWKKIMANGATSVFAPDRNNVIPRGLNDNAISYTQRSDN